jgi:hypothetical protein
MNESDEFRQQVEELKQRLGATQAQHDSQSTALTQRLASIKIMLQQKQEEIVRLSAENQQLRIMLDEVIALLNQREDLTSGQMINGFLDDIAEFIDKDDTPAVPDISIATPPAPSAWQQDEEPAVTEPAVTEPTVTEPTVTEPATTEAPVTETAVTEANIIESSAGLPVEPSASDDLKAQSIAAPEEDLSKPAAAPMSLQPKAPEPEKEEAQDDEQEEVPALKRILKRGQRGR